MVSGAHQGNAKRRILAVSSGGGHWVEMLRLMPAFAGHHVVFVTVSPMYRQDVRGYRLYTVTDVTRWSRFGLVVCCFKLIGILLFERPNIVISTGALPGYIAIRLAKLFGVRTIWVDSIANVEELSLSGQRIGPWADLWLTQWPHLAKEGGPQYVGEVF